MGETQRGGRQWRRCLAGTLRPMAAPYGYTLTIWSTGMLTVEHFGSLRTVEIAAYIVGALASTSVLILMAWGAIEAQPISAGRRGTAGGAIHVVSVPVAFGSAWLIVRAGLPLVLTAFLAAFAATLAYQLLVSLEHYVLSGEQC